MIAKNKTTQLMPYGIDIGKEPQYHDHRSLIQPLRLGWIRYPVMWHLWEPEPDKFTMPPNFARDIQEIIEDGAQVILTVKMSPGWARRGKARLCDPPDPAHLPAFCGKLAAAFPAVRHFELGNEQDCNEDWSPYFGCWGDPSKEYFGGKEYSEYINAAGDAIKAVNPDNKIWYGGLLIGKLTYPMSKYLEGSLITGARFDVLSFHNYNTHPDANTYFLSQTVDFLKSTLSQYGLAHIPLFLTEASMLSATQEYPDYSTDPHHPLYYYQCAYFFNLKQYTETNLMGFIWYGLRMNWRNCSILGADGKPKPVYYMMQPV